MTRFINTIKVAVAMAAVVSCSAANAARVENLGTGSAGGMTITVEGDLANFGGATKYSSITTTGTDQTVVISGAMGSPAPPNTDFFFNFDAADLGGLGIDVGTYQYAEIFYTLSEPFVGDGTTHQLRLDTVTPGEAQNFVSFLNRGAISNTTGAQSFVIDLPLATDLGAAAGNQFSGDLNFFRWDFFNTQIAPFSEPDVTINSGKSFTLDRVVFGTQIVSVPEPSSMAALAGCGVLALIRRKRRAAKA